MNILHAYNTVVSNLENKKHLFRDIFGPLKGLTFDTKPQYSG